MVSDLSLNLLSKASDRSFCPQDKWQAIASAYNGIYQQIKQWVAIKHCDKYSFL